MGNNRKTACSHFEVAGNTPKRMEVIEHPEPSVDAVLEGGLGDQIALFGELELAGKQTITAC